MDKAHRAFQLVKTVVFDKRVLAHAVLAGNAPGARVPDALYFSFSLARKQSHSLPKKAFAQRKDERSYFDSLNARFLPAALCSGKFNFIRIVLKSRSYFTDSVDTTRNGEGQNDAQEFLIL